MMALLDIFQSVKTGIVWKRLRYCVIDQSGIKRDWVNLAWTRILGKLGVSCAKNLRESGSSSPTWGAPFSSLAKKKIWRREQERNLYVLDIFDPGTYLRSFALIIQTLELHSMGLISSRPFRVYILSGFSPSAVPAQQFWGFVISYLYPCITLDYSETAKARTLKLG